jgi:hypothetical protein
VAPATTHGLREPAIRDLHRSRGFLGKDPPSALAKGGDEGLLRVRRSLRSRQRSRAAAWSNREFDPRDQWRVEDFCFKRGGGLSTPRCV